MKKSVLFILFTHFLFITLAFSQSKRELAIEQKARRASVAISYRTNIGLSGNAPGSHVGSGGIVDLKKGIIITNSHVSGNGPAEIEIEFYNQEKVSANILYVDPWTDFAFLKYDPQAIQNPDELEIIKFGAHEDLQVGQNVFIIGNNSGVGFSRKDGKINRLFNYSEIDGFPNIQRPNHGLHLSMDATGGSSGSVVFNEDGKVIGLFNSGYEIATENFALRVDYILDVLPLILENTIPEKGEIFTIFSKTSTNTAIKNYKIPSELISSARYVLKVESIAQDTPASSKLKPGDLIFEIIGSHSKANANTDDDDFFYNFEKIVNANVNKEVTLTLFRQGLEESLNIVLPVEKIGNGMVDRFSIFSGIVVQDIPNTFAVRYGIAQNGVYLAQMDPGHSFTRIFSTNKYGVPYTMIHKINDVEIRSLDDFNNWAENLDKGATEDITVTACNYYSLYTAPKCYPASLDISENGLSTYKWDQEELDYIPSN